jgi:hypothetical protein
MVFGGGSYDVGKNKPKTRLKHILQFAKNYNHTNIILMCVRRKLDLADSSCVSNEAPSFSKN